MDGLLLRILEDPAVHETATTRAAQESDGAVRNRPCDLANLNQIKFFSAKDDPSCENLLSHFIQ